jgi:post-segregation antitoxin (ccd killing protein)
LKELLSITLSDTKTITKNAFQFKKKRIQRVGKLEPCHTEFLCTFFAQRPEAVLWQARDTLLEMFPQIGSINLSSLHKYLVPHASLNFKKLEPVAAAERTAQSVLQLRSERVLEWQNDNSMDRNQNCVFIDEAGLNMHIRRNFG